MSGAGVPLADVDTCTMTSASGAARPRPTWTSAPVPRNASFSATKGWDVGAARSAFSTRSGASRSTVARFSNRISGGSV